MTIFNSQQEIIDNFNLFDDWLDKYQFIIDLGNQLPEFSESYKQDQYKIKGCQSNVWMYYKLEQIENKNIINIFAVSDSAIVNGLIYLLLSVYNHRTPEEILQTSPEFIAVIGLEQHLSPTRKNGLHALLRAVTNIALTTNQINSK
ncbi:MAG: SufE family protein [Gammaproteobacteria bacterium]|nr:SufE family protein [Gammaproteobacteria bacterium]